MFIIIIIIFTKKNKKGEMKGRRESQAAFGAAVSLETRESRGGRAGGRCAGGWMRLTLNCMA